MTASTTPTPAYVPKQVAVRTITTNTDQQSSNSPKPPPAIHDIPSFHARATLETWQEALGVDDLDLVCASEALDGLSDHCLILNRVHTAGRIDDSSTNLEHLQRSHQDLSLLRV